MNNILMEIHLFLCFALFFSVCTVSLYINYRKQLKKINRSKQKRNRDKRSKYLVILSLIAVIDCLAFSAYESLDLIKQDYITMIATYEYGVRDRQFSDLYFKTKDEKVLVRCYNTSEMNYDTLEEGKIYKVTYARRSRGLISCEEQ